ncbi:hypothetical protein COMNV_00665 [Commensalibacter sp. Nvir]|uniref:glycosyltransferase n=1 Tax=Commensalibacter sp. Nvir TaxID=3069817 RepID=UPI002D2C8864|nr:hypothetical protein COMNV_00665 [Commensalibacter sp. Nvir]
MVMIVLSVLSFAIWLWLCFFHGRFWSKGPFLYPIDSRKQSKRKNWPNVYVIVPARNEAQTIGEVSRSLIQQDYPGYFQILVVNDASSDNTAEIVKNIQKTLSDNLKNRLTLIESFARPEGWSGKLWALSQGMTYLKSKEKLQDDFYFFTDADIFHSPSHLTTLVDKALNENLDQVSEMVRLRCQSLFEKAFIPAFVYFFCMLYPFKKVNNPSSRVAAGAGGTVLIRCSALKKIGGISALKSALIDDVTLAALVKKKSGSIYLGHSLLATSLRSYCQIQDIWNMITRTAYVQLGYSRILLLLTIMLMSLMWFTPFLCIFITTDLTEKLSLATYIMSIITFVPTLSRFNRSYLWIFVLPFIAAFYLLATLGSAINYFCGKGMVWKGRTYANSVSEKQHRQKLYCDQTSFETYEDQ